MENSKLRDYLVSDALILRVFDGLYNLDTFPNSLSPGRLYAVNLATATETYGHFVLIHTLCDVEYLCSANTSYREFPRLKQILESYASDIYMFPERTQLQFSTSCSIHVMFNAFMVSRGIYGREIYHRFFERYTSTRQVLKLELFITEVIQRLFHLKQGITQSYLADIDFLIGQARDEQKHKKT